MKNKRGFTLIELLAIIVILAILIIAAVPNIIKIYNNAKLNSFLNQAKSIYNAANNQIMSNELENNSITRFCYATKESSNPLKLSGNKKVYYLVEIKKDKIIRLIISTEEYSISLINIQGTNIVNIEKNEVSTKNDVNYILLERCGIDVFPKGYVLATDADFSGTTNGSFRYIGTAEYVIMPHIIKGISVTSYSSMFKNASVKGVFSDNDNITNMESTFYNGQGTTLDLSNFDTSNVANMYSMFYGNQAWTLDLSSFNTSKVTTMEAMLYESEAATLDLSGFNTSKVTTMENMFYRSQAVTLDLSSFDISNVSNTNFMFSYSSAVVGYSRTQADADKFNSSINMPKDLTFIIKP